MKKLILLFAISLAVISCGKDDDSSNSNKLAKPTLLTPSNNATVEVSEFDMYGEFVWVEIANARQYLVQISASSSFSDILVEGTIEVDDDDPYYNNRIYFNLYESGQDQTTYYWRIRAFAPDYDPSDYSTAFSFLLNIE